MTDDPICTDCGRPKSEHGVDQYSGRQVRCPVRRESTTDTPPQEHRRSPSGDY